MLASLNSNLPLVVACIIIAVITVLITLFGYNLINYTERFAFVVMCVGCSARARLIGQVDHLLHAVRARRSG